MRRGAVAQLPIAVISHAAQASVVGDTGMPSARSHGKSGSQTVEGGIAHGLQLIETRQGVAQTELAVEVASPTPCRRLTAHPGPGVISCRTAPQAIYRVDGTKTHRTRRLRAIRRRAVANLPGAVVAPTHQHIGGGLYACMLSACDNCRHRAGQAADSARQAAICGRAVAELPASVVTPARHDTRGR